MSYEDLDKSKNLFEYHSVFASTLAIYLNIRKEIESSKSFDVAAKRKEALAILRSNTLYAIVLKRNDVENEGIPTDETGLLKWYAQKEEQVKKAASSPDDALDTLFCLMVRKQEVAGLTANSEKSYTSKMNMLISQVEREKRRDDNGDG